MLKAATGAFHMALADCAKGLPFLMLLLNAISSHGCEFLPVTRSLALTSGEKFPGDLCQGRSLALLSLNGWPVIRNRKSVEWQTEDLGEHKKVKLELSVKTRKSKTLLIRRTNENGPQVEKRKYYFVPPFIRDKLNCTVLHQIVLGINFKIYA